MIYLSKIYTKTGDGGETSLGDGSRVPKDDLRVEAFGTVDELNSLLGLFLASVGDFPERPLILDICNDLFDVGGDLCIPVERNEPVGKCLRVAESQVTRLEACIDRFNDRLQPLTSFVLPGGSAAAAWCHLARTVCRRAERQVVSLQKIHPLNPQVQVYLNRLSDLLFVLARCMNDDGKADVLWQPGRNR